MKVISANLGQIFCTKPPKYVSEIIDSEKSFNYSFNFNNFDILEKSQVICSVSIDIRSKNEKEKLIEFRCHTVVDTDISGDDLKRGEEIRADVAYFSLVQSWPIFESQYKILRDFKVDIPMFPSVPSLDDVKNKLQSLKK